MNFLYRAGGISWYRKCRYPSSDSYDYYTIGKVCSPWVCRASSNIILHSKNESVFHTKSMLPVTCLHPERCHWEDTFGMKYTLPFLL